MIRKKWSVLCAVLFLAATLNGCAAPAVQEGLEEAESRQPSSEQPQSSEELSSEEPQYTEEPPVSHEAQQTPAETVEAVPEEADSETDEDDPSDWTWWRELVRNKRGGQIPELVLEGLTLRERITQCTLWAIDGLMAWDYRIALLDIIGDERPELCVHSAAVTDEYCWFYDVVGDRAELIAGTGNGYGGPCWDEVGWQIFRAEYPDGKEGYIIETRGNQHYQETNYLWKQEDGRPLNGIVCVRDHWDPVYVSGPEDGYYQYDLYSCDGWSDESERPLLDAATWNRETETEEEFLAKEEGTLLYELYTLPRLEPVPVTDMGKWFAIEGDGDMAELEEYVDKLLEMYMAEHGIEAD